LLLFKLYYHYHIFKNFVQLQALFSVQVFLSIILVLCSLFFSKYLFSIIIFIFLLPACVWSSIFLYFYYIFFINEEDVRIASRL